MILDIEIKIKRHNKHVNYLGCVLDETILGETMALRAIEKINSRLMFNYLKNRGFLDVPLRRILCNALIQPYFDCCLYCVALKLEGKKYAASYTKQNALDFT